MSAEQPNPVSGATPGEPSEEELRKILGEDYEAVVGARAAGGLHAPDGNPEDEMVGQTRGPDQARSPAQAGVSTVQADPVAEDSRPGSPGEAGLEGDEWPGEPVPVRPVHFAQLEEAGGRRQGSIDVLLDVKLPISVELGRTEMLVKEILDCGPGTVIELDKLAGEPVDVFINGRMVAQGEVVVVDEHFGVRVTSLLSPRDRVRSLA